MQSVLIGKCEVGRVARIIVPLTGHTLTELEREAKALADLPADIAEWRVDLYGGHSGPWRGEDVLEPLDMLSRTLRVPLLATFRTAAEGGRAIEPHGYRLLCERLCGSGKIHALDVEAFSMGTEMAGNVAAVAHAHGVAVVASSHDFSSTPPHGEIVRRLGAMHDVVGADIAKIAVMPRRPEDVLTLLSAVLESFRRARGPLIAMSMGEMGMASRFSGHLFGSAAAFGRARQASAPGQPDAHLLAAALDAAGRTVGPSSGNDASASDAGQA